MQVIGRCAYESGEPGNNEGGVVAFANSGDADLGEYDEEPAIIFRAARLPPPFDEA